MLVRVGKTTESNAPLTPSPSWWGWWWRWSWSLVDGKQRKLTLLVHFTVGSSGSICLQGHQPVVSLYTYTYSTDTYTHYEHLSINTEILHSLTTNCRHNRLHSISTFQANVQCGSHKSKSNAKASTSRVGWAATRLFPPDHCGWLPQIKTKTKTKTYTFPDALHTSHNSSPDLNWSLLFVVRIKESPFFWSFEYQLAKLAIPNCGAIECIKLCRPNGECSFRIFPTFPGLGGPPHCLAGHFSPSRGRWTGLCSANKHIMSC